MRILNIESTPNPNALKFTVDARLVTSGSRSFTSKDAAESNELAHALFELDGVVSLFFMDRFVTVSKATDKPWNDLEPDVRNLLERSEYSLPNEPATSMHDEPPRPPAAADNEAMLKQINELLDETVRPALAGDGGGLEIISLRDNVLTIHYQGACGTCPSSIQGTLGAIENLLRHGVDPNISVIAAETADFHA